MAKVTATCDMCGSVTFTSNDVKVRTCLDTHETTYVFKCQCGLVNTRPCPNQVQDILISAGARFETWRKETEPINESDVQEFKSLLQQDDWFDQLLRMT